MCTDLLTNAQHCNGAQIQTLLFARPIPVGTSMGAHSPKYTFGRMWTRRPACVFKPPKPMTCSLVSPLHAALLAVPPDKTPGWFCFRLPSSEITQKLFPTSSLQTLGYFFLSASGGTKPPRAGAGCFFPGCFQGGRRAELGGGTRCSYLGSLPIPGTTLHPAPRCSPLSLRAGAAGWGQGSTHPRDGQQGGVSGSALSPPAGTVPSPAMPTPPPCPLLRSPAAPRSFPVPCPGGEPTAGQSHPNPAPSPAPSPGGRCAPRAASSGRAPALNSAGGSAAGR